MLNYLRPYFLCCIFFMVFSGCVTRTLVIDSQPPGAMVYLDDREIGYTPVTTTFTYYGTRKIQLEKTDAEGRLIYERLIVYEDIKPPLYQVFPLDFFSELILPMELKDEHHLTYQLMPLKPVPQTLQEQRLLRNAMELREQVIGPVH